MLFKYKYYNSIEILYKIEIKLISISLYDNKRETISVLLLDTAISKAEV